MFEKELIVAKTEAEVMLEIFESVMQSTEKQKKLKRKKIHVVYPRIFPEKNKTGLIVDFPMISILILHS